MMQFSVYYRHCGSLESCEKHIKYLQKNIPFEGKISILKFTDKINLTKENINANNYLLFHNSFKNGFVFTSFNWASIAKSTAFINASLS
mgnify:CR=1 FL=1